jgi:hypothetical protein
MERKPISLDSLIRAVLKLDLGTGERHNVIRFLQSCYGCRVRDYDFDAAQASLGRLTDEEQHALISHCMRMA